MNHFDRIANEYDDSLPEHVRRHYFEKRMKFIASVMPNGIVLDVGAGTGIISEGLISRGYEVISFDLSAKMLQVRRYLAGYHPVYGTSESLPFKDKSFDLVISIAMLHHLAEPLKICQTLEEMKRVTKQGGVILVWDHNPINPYWPLLMRRVPQDTGKERLVRLKEIVKPFRDAGFVCTCYRTGFVPDFIPPALLPLAKKIESFVEKIPLLRLFAAHNVVVARKL